MTCFKPPIPRSRGVIYFSPAYSSLAWPGEAKSGTAKLDQALPALAWLQALTKDEDMANPVFLLIAAKDLPAKDRTSFVELWDKLCACSTLDSAQIVCQAQPSSSSSSSLVTSVCAVQAPSHWRRDCQLRNKS